jgi:hypothetical protein
MPDFGSLGLSECPTDTFTQSDSPPFKGESECVSVQNSDCGDNESESEWIDERKIDEPF